MASSIRAISSELTIFFPSGDTRELMARVIGTLPERERLVMALYYDEELNLRETGEVLGVSESRVCQIHSQALMRLRARITQIVDGED